MPGGGRRRRVERWRLRLYRNNPKSEIILRVKTAAKVCTCRCKAKKPVRLDADAAGAVPLQGPITLLRRLESGRDAALV